MTLALLVSSGSIERLRLPAWGATRPTLAAARQVQESPAAADAAMGKYAQGDSSAFLDLYDALAPQLFRLLVRLSRNPTLAEDLVQQTFLQMHDARGRFLPGSPVKPWAFAIARRLFIDVMRRQGREVVVRDADNQLPEPIEPVHAGDWHEARQTADRAERQLLRLPEQQREAYLLVKTEGLSLAEAASVLGTTVAAVKLRVHRAVVALRSALADPLASKVPTGASHGS